MTPDQKNMLIRMVLVQQMYEHHKKNGATGVWIHRNVVYPRFLISIGTMNRYLSENPKKQLTEAGIDWRSEVQKINEKLRMYGTGN